jgi:putative bacteriocin precursor
MKKALKKRENRGQKNLQLYSCDCSSCGGCGSGHGSADYENVKKAHRNYVNG